LAKTDKTIKITIQELTCQTLELTLLKNQQ